MALNSSQVQAVQTTEGPLLIIAGPGSGKTHTLVERIIYLITEKKVQPEQILISTFTEKAAAELITRVSNRLAELDMRINLNEMYIGTLHSICLRILDKYRHHTRLGRNYAVWDQFDQQYIVYQNRQFFRKLEDVALVIGEDQTGGWKQAENLIYWVNKVTEEAVELEKLEKAKEPEVRALGRLVKAYRDFLHQENALDFSTIQTETYDLLIKNPSVLAELRENIRYIMIDEYQDTNTIQEMLVLLLAGEQANICVVGDDDQGLYRFRGATIRNILEFPKHFAEGKCKQIFLTTNYRSTPEIIDFYNRWMQQTDWSDQGKTFRYEKTIVPEERTFPEAPSVLKLSAKDDIDRWCREVHKFIAAIQESGALADYNQIAFLFRSVKNEKVVALAEYLEEQKIPVFSPRSNLFFEREEIRLMVGALVYCFITQFQRVIIEQWKGKGKLEVWAYYEECVAELTLELKKKENKEILLWLKDKASAHATMTENMNYAFSGLFYELLQFPLFSRYLGTDGGGHMHDSRPARNLAQLSRILTKFEYLHKVSVLGPKFIEYQLGMLFNFYLRFLKAGGIEEFEDPSEYAPPGCVSFMTIHQSKGLEFPVVLVGSLEARPTKQHDELTAILQEKYFRKEPFEPLDKTKFYDFWRLYYTAFSRAQSVLMLTTVENDEGSWKSPSEYLKRTGYDDLPTWRSLEAHWSALELKPMKPTNLKREYSFTSHITVFENCARQYKFFKELEFAPVRKNAMLFGQLVHQTIEDLHRAAIAGEAARIHDTQIEDWFHKNYRFLSAKERLFLAPGALESALRQVKEYARFRSNSWDKVVEAEVDVSLAKETYILNGTIDLIEGEDNTVEIVDFKTENKPDMHDESERIQLFRRQLELYAHIVQERHGKAISGLQLYFTGETNSSPVIRFEMKPTSVANTVTGLDAVVRKIERKDFAIADRPTKLCKSCDMNHYCDRL